MKDHAWVGVWWLVVSAFSLIVEIGVGPDNDTMVWPGAQCRFEHQGETFGCSERRRQTFVTCHLVDHEYKRFFGEIVWAGIAACVDFGKTAGSYGFHQCAGSGAYVRCIRSIECVVYGGRLGWIVVYSTRGVDNDLK
jgi:hypothetical protein